MPEIFSGMKKHPMGNQHNTCAFTIDDLLAIPPNELLPLLYNSRVRELCSNVAFWQKYVERYESQLLQELGSDRLVAIDQALRMDLIELAYVLARRWQQLNGGNTALMVLYSDILRHGFRRKDISLIELAIEAGARPNLVQAFWLLEQRRIDIVLLTIHHPNDWIELLRLSIRSDNPLIVRQIVEHPTLRPIFDTRLLVQGLILAHHQGHTRVANYLLRFIDRKALSNFLGSEQIDDIEAYASRMQ